MGNAIEKLYEGALLCDGPATKEGFFYEFLNEGRVKLGEEELSILSKLIQKQVEGNFPFERLVVSKTLGKKMFEENRMKVELVERAGERGGEISVYRCGDFVDLCRGPHLPNTGLVKAFLLTHSSSPSTTLSNSYRVHGISFPNTKLFQEWKKQKEEAAKRDHRNLGRQLKLFMFHPLSPGAPFFLPDGAHIYNKLVQLMRQEYKKRGYQEVITPLLFNHKLWNISGHWENYKEDMFLLQPNHHHHQPSQNLIDTAREDTVKEDTVKEDTVGLKPMNCPGHCLIFSGESRSYRELPLRLADFGVLHRNEKEGALTGLTRVRKFQQDDAHIFCREKQIEQEVLSCLDFLSHIYGLFGFQFALRLSTRPSKYMGEEEVWERAEETLRKALEQFSCQNKEKLFSEWSVNEGDGAFYGPKIDVEVKDAIGRSHQCATIQLDFQLPRRFGLKYIDEEGSLATPVLIHRAILGSLERMMAILIEHTSGKWPFWLNPKQITIIPVHHDRNRTYARWVESQLKELYYCVHCDLSDSTLSKKVRNAQLEGYSYILVVGEEEERERKVNVRERDNSLQSQTLLATFIHQLSLKSNPFV